MKTIKFVFALMIAFILAGGTMAQAGSKPVELKMKSSVVCGQCKDRVEGGLAFEKGVKMVNVDLKSKEVTVKYNPAKTTPDQLRTALSKLGYDADGVKADAKAYEKLPSCCKKDAAAH